MSNNQPLRFVHLQKPGQKYQLDEHKAVRIHVRRAIVREKKSRHIDQNIRIFTPSDWPTHKPKARLKSAGSKGQRPPHQRLQSRSDALVALPDGAIVGEVVILPAANQNSNCPLEAAEDARVEDMAPDCELWANPTLYHPFTTSTSKLVGLPEARLDQMFKSDVFKLVGEPCFDTSQIDENRNIDLVFPSSLSDPVFMHTLVYSMLQIQHQQRDSLEMLAFERRTIQMLNQAIALTKPPSVSVIGAIMLLTASAWRLGDQDVHKAHSSGLWQALQMTCSLASCPLTPAATRALFWLDLFSSMLMNSQRRMSHLTLPSQPQWHRLNLPLSVYDKCYLPIGFEKHRRVIPDDLLDCLEDIGELQATMAKPRHRRDYMLLDDMQASIESRLSFQGKACRNFGEISEMIRLAAFICCYCCWMDTWNCNIIPVKIAKKLAELIERSMDMEKRGGLNLWDDHVELLLWVLFVGASIAENERWYANGTKQAYETLMRRTGEQISTFDCTNPPIDQFVKTTLEQFLHCEYWIEKRMCMREWFALEVLIDAKLNSHDVANEVHLIDSMTETSWHSHLSME